MLSRVYRESLHLDTNVIALVYRWFKRRSEVMYAKGESESGGSHAKTPGN